MLKREEEVIVGGDPGPGWPRRGEFASRRGESPEG